MLITDGNTPVVRRRVASVLWGVAAVAGGAVLLHWFRASAVGYAPADPAYRTEAPASDVPVLVLYAVVAVIGVCLAAVGWWRPFLLGVALAYVAGGLAPLLGDAPERLSPAGMAVLEAALLAGPTWVVADRSRARPRRVPVPSRLALAARGQHALPKP